jgi:hypothetical protein
LRTKCLLAQTRSRECCCECSPTERPGIPAGAVRTQGLGIWPVTRAQQKVQGAHKKCRAQIKRLHKHHQEYRVGAQSPSKYTSSPWQVSKVIHLMRHNHHHTKCSSKGLGFFWCNLAQKNNTAMPTQGSCNAAVLMSPEKTKLRTVATTTRTKCSSLGRHSVNSPLPAVEQQRTPKPTQGRNNNTYKMLVPGCSHAPFCRATI